MWFLIFEMRGNKDSYQLETTRGCDILSICDDSGDWLDGDEIDTDFDCSYTHVTGGDLEPRKVKGVEFGYQPPGAAHKSTREVAELRK